MQSDPSDPSLTLCKNRDRLVDSDSRDANENQGFGSRNIRYNRLKITGCLLESCKKKNSLKIASIFVENFREYFEDLFGPTF